MEHQRILLDLETQRDLFRRGYLAKDGSRTAGNVRDLFRWARDQHVPVISTVLRLRRQDRGPFGSAPHCVEGSNGERKLPGTILPVRINLGMRNSTDLPLTAGGSPLLYNLGINALFATGIGLELLYDTSSVAFRYLDSALQADHFSLRIKRDYRRMIDPLQDRPHVIVIDLPRIFNENGGERLFIDHCHPTAEGHLLIAQSLSAAICKRFKLLL